MQLDFACPYSTPPLKTEFLFEEFARIQWQIDSSIRELPDL